MASSHVYAGPAATALPATPKRGGGGCAMNNTQSDLNAPRGVATTFIENSTYDYAFLEGRMLTCTRNAPRLLSARYVDLIKIPRSGLRLLFFALLAFGFELRVLVLVQDPFCLLHIFVLALF